MGLGRFCSALALLAAMAAAPSGADARELMVVGFGGGFQDNARNDLFQAYAKATGESVRDDVYNGELARITAMVQAHNVTWDVVMVEAPELVRGCEDGTFARIDYSVVRRDKFMPGSSTACGVGAVGWGVSLFYDQKRFPDGPKTYADMWDLQKWPGKRLMRSGPKMTLEIALLADGVAPDKVYQVLATKEGQDRAFRKLDAIKPELLWWKAGTQPLQLIGSGEVAFAVGYVGRTAHAAAEGAAYPLLWNTLLYSYDSWTVVRGSPNAAEAMRFLDFITDPAPLENLAQHWEISPATRAVAEDPAVRQRNPAMIANHQAEGLFIDTGFWSEHGEDLEKRFAVWASH